ncbi:hypothetical protein KUCAC02_020295 [Chaenocephalus aceratus]|uniref:Uncharacterized protein n=1 Tax=Chaenocephalus aceratus TaxID=36190 RepID=A0ACB9VRA9_CHAAC|nr:hypothetical protein KUCAC02_020295 [Chaenocephalus aceratus]
MAMEWKEVDGVKEACQKSNREPGRNKFNLRPESHPADQSAGRDCSCAVNPVDIHTNMTPVTPAAEGGP